MARILCSISGIDFHCDHMSIYNTQSQSHHPIFDLSRSHLLDMYESQYLEQKLSKIENYLYYTALLKSSELIQFRVATRMCEKTQSIIANNMHRLFIMIQRIHAEGSERTLSILNLPTLVITPDTCTLENSKYWIELWENNYSDYKNGYKATNLVAELNRRELQLESRIKNHDDPSKYGAMLAEWAALAGNFPHTPDTMLYDEVDNVVYADDYWKKIIRIAAKGESIFHIPMEDINDVIDQCEENIDHGSIQAHSLMAILRSAKERKHNYLGLGDINIRSAFKILDADSSVEDANMQAMLLSAPKEEPKESAYPNKLAYRIALIKYKQAQEHAKNSPAQEPEVIKYEPQLNAVQDSGIGEQL